MNLNPIAIVIAIVVGLVCLAVGIIAGIQIRKNNAEKEIGSAEQEATRIVNLAIKEAETKKREMVLAAQETIQKERADLDAEIKERRTDLQKQERRLQQKEDNLDRKTDAIEKKDEKLQARLAAAEKTREEVKALKKSEMELLEKLSGLTAEEAKAYLIEQLSDEVTHEEAVRLKEIQAHYKEEAETYAREQIALAIQRCAADHVAESTVSVVPLPNDEMKGRIIGREGRNIRALETLTGVGPHHRRYAGGHHPVLL